MSLFFFGVSKFCSVTWNRVDFNLKLENTKVEKNIHWVVKTDHTNYYFRKSFQVQHANKPNKNYCLITYWLRNNYVTICRRFPIGLKSHDKSSFSKCISSIFSSSSFSTFSTSFRSISTFKAPYSELIAPFSDGCWSWSSYLWLV